MTIINLFLIVSAIAFLVMMGSLLKIVLKKEHDEKLWKIAFISYSVLVITMFASVLTAIIKSKIGI